MQISSCKNLVLSRGSIGRLCLVVVEVCGQFIIGLLRQFEGVGGRHTLIGELGSMGV